MEWAASTHALDTYCEAKHAKMPIALHRIALSQAEATPEGAHFYNQGFLHPHKLSGHGWLSMMSSRRLRLDGPSGWRPPRRPCLSLRGWEWWEGEPCHRMLATGPLRPGRIEATKSQRPLAPPQDVGRAGCLQFMPSPALGLCQLRSMPLWR